MERSLRNCNYINFLFRYNTFYITYMILTLAIPKFKTKVFKSFGGSVELQILTMPSAELVIRLPCVRCTPVI